MGYFMENPIKMDDLGVPLFLETPISEIPKKNMYILLVASYKNLSKASSSDPTPASV